ncbi:MAG: hypothetical protein KAS39_08480 [Actinomycetia bacterium]|nr:hypothetical protein [Actinomycetes bacterium]
MGTDWAAEQLDAYNDIKDEGVAIRLTLTSGGTYDPIADTVTGAGTLGYPTYAINTKFKDWYDSEAHVNRSEATAVKRGDRMLLIPAYGLPDIANAGSEQDWNLTYKGNVYSIVYTEAIEPGGVAVLFRMAARR